MEKKRNCPITSKNTINSFMIHNFLAASCCVAKNIYKDIMALSCAWQSQQKVLKFISPNKN